MIAFPFWSSARFSHTSRNNKHLTLSALVMSDQLQMKSNQLQINDRISRVFERTLRVDREKLSDRTRRGDLEEWDSLGHLVLVEALSEEFKVNISPESALDMETIHDIKLVLSKLQEQQS